VTLIRGESGERGYRIRFDADPPAVAEALYRGLSSHAPAGRAVSLDVPEIHPGAMALAELHGLRRVFETARIDTGSAPDVEMDRVSGGTTCELGQARRSRLGYG
jgi:hypothetical protein